MNYSLPTFLLILIAASTVPMTVALLAAGLGRRQAASFRHFIWLLALGAPLVAVGLIPLGLKWTVPVLPAIPAQMGNQVVSPVLHRSGTAVPAPVFSGEKPASEPSFDTKPVFDAHTLVDPALSVVRPKAPQAVIRPAVQNFAFAFPRMNFWWLLWGLGLGFVAVKIVADYVRVEYFLRHHCRPASPEVEREADVIQHQLGLKHRPRIVMASPTQVPFCHGLGRSVVVLPKCEDSGELSTYLRHEFAHLVRWDLHWLFLSRLICALCWFNPLVWMAAKNLRNESELAADDLVLASGTEPDIYATHILDLVKTCQLERAPGSISLAMAQPGGLTRRIQSIMDGTLRRKSPGLFWLSFLGLAMVVLVVGLVSIRLVHKEVLVEDPGHEAVGKIPVHVVDEQDRPIVGAEVVPIRFYEDLASRGWYLPGKTADELSRMKFLTDQNGDVTLLFPQKPGVNPTDNVTIRVSHPDYALSEEINLFPGKSKKITLVKGERLSLQAKTTEGTVLTGLMVNMERRSGAKWHASADGKQLISDTPLPLGGFKVQGVVENAQGYLLYSEVQTVVLDRPGETTVDLVMRPARQIQGKLDASIPRPVKNGFVLYGIQPSGSDDMDWRGCTTVAEDGSFTIKDVPPGNLELVAKCEGYISSQPKVDDGAERDTDSRNALAYSEADLSHLSVSMEPTGSVKIKVVDQQKQPVAGAEVDVVGLNYRIHGGATFLGNGGTSTLNRLKKAQLQSNEGLAGYPQIQWKAVTDREGVATVTDVPGSTRLEYEVSKNGYVMPDFKVSWYGTLPIMDVASGQTTEVPSFGLLPASAKGTVMPVPDYVIAGKKFVPDSIPYRKVSNPVPKTITARGVSNKQPLKNESDSELETGLARLDFKAVHELPRPTRGHDYACFIDGDGSYDYPYNFVFQCGVPAHYEAPEGVWVKFTASNGKTAYAMNTGIFFGVDLASGEPKDDRNFTTATNVFVQLGWEPQDGHAPRADKVNWQFVPAAEVPSGPWISTEDDAATFTHRYLESREFTSALTESIHRGDFSKVKELWEKFAAEGSPRYCSEITYAISQDRPISELEDLLKRGGEVNAPGLEVSPLAVAAAKGNVPVYQWLVDHGAKQAEYDRYVPLNLATAAGKTEMVAYLVGKGDGNMDLGSLRSRKDTPEYRNLVQMLVKAGRIHPSSNPGTNAFDLLLTAKYGNLFLLQTLLQQGYDPLSHFDDRNQNKWAGLTVLDAIKKEDDQEKLAPMIAEMEKAVEKRR